MKYGWWIAATDEVEEGLWKWKQSGENITYSAWFKGKDIPKNENWFSYGGADCVAVIPKEHFSDVDIEKDDEGKDYDKDKGEDDKCVETGDFKWFNLSCYIRSIPVFNVKMSPLCKL